MKKGWMTRDWTIGDLNALVKNLGGEEAARKIQKGEVRVSLKDPLELLFDKHGRRRIPKGLQANIRDANRNFRLDQAKLDEEVDFTNHITWFEDALRINTGITGIQFQQEYKRLRDIISSIKVANILNGVCLPVVLPKLVTDDLGAELELYLAGVNNSYAKTFGDRKFYNHRKGTLANEVSIVNGSRHDQLISRMKKGPVIGLHFPNPLQGFSINAQREQMSTLPEGFILSGMDTPIAMVMYPGVLARDYNTPGLDLPALQWRSADYSLSFGGADGGTLDFDNTGILASADGNYSGGLLFLW